MTGVDPLNWCWVVFPISLKWNSQYRIRWAVPAFLKRDKIAGVSERPIRWSELTGVADLGSVGSVAVLVVWLICGWSVADLGPIKPPAIAFESFIRRRIGGLENSSPISGDTTRQLNTRENMWDPLWSYNIDWGGYLYVGRQARAPVLSAGGWI